MSLYAIAKSIYHQVRTWPLIGGVCRGSKSFFKALLLPWKNASLTDSNEIVKLTKQVEWLNGEVARLKWETNRLIWWVGPLPKMVYSTNKYFMDFYVKPMERVGVEEHKKNVETLFRGLDEGARDRLSRILSRFDKMAKGPVRMNEAYTDSDWEQYLDFLVFTKKEIKKSEQGAYEWSNFKLPVNSFDASVFLYRHGIDALKTFKNIGTKSIIDVGGFIADSVLVFRKYTQNTIYSFEPGSKNYALALETIKLNALKDVVLENIALGDKPQRLKMSSYAGDDVTGGGSLVLPYGRCPEEEEVEVDTLDNYVKKYGIQVGLIKVDVEGYEQNFLRGALETIREQKPAMLLSIYHTYDDFYKIKPFIEDLNLGYKFDFFKGPDGSCRTDIMLLCEVR